MNTNATQVAVEQPAYVAPRNDAERRLVHIWEEAFQHQPIGIREDFFSLGGDSMLAVAIFEKIEQTFDCKLPLAILMEHPTIEQLSPLVSPHPEKAVSWSALVPIQTQGRNTPFFAVHAESNVLFYKTLADTLGTDQPFYALQTLGLDGSRPPFDDIESMARHYVSEIRGVQSTGPYIISGMCFGAWIALEMAQQLISAGETIKALIVFDSGGPRLRKSTDEPDPDARTDKSLIDKIITHTREGRILKVTSHFSKSVKQDLKLKAERALLGPMEKRILDVKMRHKKMKAAYRADKYPGKIHFFRSKHYHRKKNKLGQLPQWNEICTQGVESYLISSAETHNTILSPPAVYDVAKIINTILEGAGNPAGNSSTKTP